MFNVMYYVYMVLVIITIITIGSILFISEIFFYLGSECVYESSRIYYDLNSANGILLFLFSSGNKLSLMTHASHFPNSMILYSYHNVHSFILLLPLQHYMYIHTSILFL